MAKKVWRIIGVIVGVLAVALLILWILGGRTSRHVAEITIAASPDDVFQYLAEPDKARQWMEGVVEITPLGDSTQQVGAKARIVIAENESRFEMEDEVIRYEANRLFEVRIMSSMFDLTSLYELSEFDVGKSHVKHTLRADYKGFVRIFAPLMGGDVQRKLESDFQRLKKLVESERASPMSPKV